MRGDSYSPFAEFTKDALDDAMLRYQGDEAAAMTSVCRGLFTGAIDNLFLSFTSTFLFLCQKREGADVFRVEQKRVGLEEERQWILFFELDHVCRVVFFLGACNHSTFISKADMRPHGSVNRWVLSKSDIDPRQPHAWVLQRASPPLPEAPKPEPARYPEMPLWIKMWPSFFPEDLAVVEQVIKECGEDLLAQVVYNRLEGLFIFWKNDRKKRQPGEALPEALQEQLYSSTEQDIYRLIFEDVAARYLLCAITFRKGRKAHVELGEWYLQQEAEVFLSFAHATLDTEVNLASYVDGVGLRGGPIKEEDDFTMSPQVVDALKRHGGRKEANAMWFSVEWKTCVPLVVSGDCLLWKGRCYLTWKQVRDHVLPHLLRERMRAVMLAERLPVKYHSKLDTHLANACEGITLRDPPQRLPPALKDKALPDIEDLGRHDFLPLCQQVLFDKLTGTRRSLVLVNRAAGSRNKHLNFPERHVFAKALMDIGYSREQVMQFVKKYEKEGGTTEGTVTNDYKGFEKPNPDGQFGRGCRSMLSDEWVRDEGRGCVCIGCPFKFYKSAELDDLLFKHGVASEVDRERIMEVAKKENQHKDACSEHLLARHGLPDTKLFPEKHHRPAAWSWRAMQVRGALRA